MLINLCDQWGGCNGPPVRDCCQRMDRYSFPSGHSNGATLLYGSWRRQIVPMLQGGIGARSQLSAL